MSLLRIAYQLPNILTEDMVLSQLFCLHGNSLRKARVVSNVDEAVSLANMVGLPDFGTFAGHRRSINVPIYYRVVNSVIFDPTAEDFKRNSFHYQATDITGKE
ncbi:hypothetical protein BHYA_0093g00300 [Botrytis hyacinthi]|uniref:Uncharacterized protein n=1 Tax=Botrytis hyacinthi TaxID=278943 RepID=A0A4Z1GL29_9HELO|nr:hypothetical protein BHYA_0093g00300 [Botrytis hyacinthi]